MENYSMETLELAAKAKIQEKFIEEVTRLINTKTVDPAYHSRGLLFGVALENIADCFLRGERKTKAYRNLKLF